MKAVLTAPVLWITPSQFAVLVLLADKVNDGGDPKRHIPPGYAWPSKGYLADRLGITPRQAVNIVRDLEELGLVEVQRGGGWRGSNLYRITVDRALAMTRGEAHFIPDDTERDETSFTPAVVIEPSPVKSATPTGEVSAPWDEAHCTPGVKPISPELLSDPFSDPLKETLSVVRVRAEKESRRKDVSQLAKVLLTQQRSNFSTHEDLCNELKARLPDVDIDQIREGSSLAWGARHALRQMAI